MQAVENFADRCAEDFVNSFHQLIKIHEFGLYDGLQDMKPFMKTLDDFQTHFKDAVRRKTAPRLRQRNASLPISKLPVELTQSIFHAALFWDSGERHEEYVKTLLTLRLVSGAWRELIDRTPFLWTHLSSGDHPSFISRAFEISENYPLHLMYTDGPVDRYELELFWDQALGQLHCWESVLLHNPDWEDVESYFTRPAPRLKRVTLTTNESWDNTGFGPIPLFGGSWESMEEVHINKFYELEWSGVGCRRLRILEIRSCTNLDLIVMIGIIQKNQDLEILRLQDIEFISTSSLLPPSQQPAVLSHLRVLALTNLHFNAEDDSDVDPIGLDPPAFHIFRHIQFPHCADFSLTLYGLESLTGQMDLKYLTTSFSHPPDLFSLPALATALSAADSLVTILSPGEVTLGTRPDVSQRIEFEISLWNVPQSFARTTWIGDMIARKPGEPRPELRLVLLVEDELSGFDALAEFQDWEVVTDLSVELHVANRDQAASQLLDWLAIPHTSASGATGIPFPRLRRIDAEALDYAGGQAIVDMIKTRFSTPGVDPPENIITRSSGGERSFKWPDVDEICTLFWLKSICFV